MAQLKSEIRVMLVDDQTMIRQGLGYVIGLQEDMAVVGEAGDGNTAVKLALDKQPDVILMDVQMPGRSGLEATKEIMQALPATKVVILTTFDEQDYVFEGIRAGAVGYLLKDADTQVMLEAIRAAQRGEAVYRTETAASALSRALCGIGSTSRTTEAGAVLLEPLTEREQEVLQQMSYGLRNDQIAKQMSISEGTVKTHIHRILQKFGAEDRTRVVVTALRHGLVK